MKGFVKISRYSGMREDLVQASGGNSSFKISGEKMAIKASGYQLADITEYDGYALVNPTIIREKFLGCDDLDVMTESDGKAIIEEAFIGGSRPSIETFLHAISGKYTLHTHPVAVNVLTCRKKGMEVLKTLFPDAITVPYATPGVSLAKSYFKAYKSKNVNKSCVFDIVFLQNHGLLVSADSADEVIEKTEAVTKRIEEYLKIDLLAYHNLSKIWTFFPDKIIWMVTDSNVLKVYNNIGEWQSAFCPDCVVFLGKRFLKLMENFCEADIKEFYAVYGAPVIICYEGVLYIVADSVNKAMEIQSVMSFSAQVMALNHGYECNLLIDSEQNFLLNWDAEKYRKTMG